MLTVTDATEKNAVIITLF